MRLTYLVFGLLGLFWGSNFIYMKWATELITPAQITLLRVFFGFLPLAFVARRKGVIQREQVRHLPHFLVMAVLATAFYHFAIAEGTARLPSGIAGVLGGSIALFTTIATLLFLSTEKPNALMLTGVLVGFAGIILIARPWEGADRSRAENPSAACATGNRSWRCKAKRLQPHANLWSGDGPSGEALAEKTQPTPIPDPSYRLRSVPSAGHIANG